MPLFGSHRRNDYASPTEQPPQDDVSYDDAPSRSIRGTLFPRRNRSTSPSSTEINTRGSNSGNRSGSGSGLGIGGAGGNNAYDDPNVGANRNGSRRTGFFGRQRSSSFSDGQSTASPARGGSMRSGTGRSSNSNIFGHNSDTNFSKDPAIIGARSKVSDAEAAERQADRALIDARAAVREAREEVKELERTVAEEARLAKLKQQEARAVSKSAKGLGRHG